MPEESRFLLDTHVWVWLMEDAGGLSQKLVARLNQAAERKNVLIAAISLWEVCMLVEKKRLDFKADVLHWLNKALLHPGLNCCPLTPYVAAESCKLPGAFHADPADRLIVATARVENAILVTKDESILDYAKSGHVQVLEA
jgi:PIN domain nuclease of toxin-antitoxin system